MRSCNLNLAPYSESLQYDNKNLSHAGMARTAPAHGLTELFLITYFALLYAQILHYTILIPFLQIIIINMDNSTFILFINSKEASFAVLKLEI